MTRLRQGIAAPCFGDVADLVELGVRAEEAGFDGFFVWDHLLFADDGDGPPIVDPWAVLAVVAARTSRIRIGPMVTPISRRRPWVLARQCATLDALSGGRFVLGAGLGSPARGDFERFGEVSDARERAGLLDEGLAILDGLWSGDWFSHHGPNYQVDRVRFQPTPVQRPRIPIWLGGVLPARRPLDRAARWDGVVPIRFAERRVVRPSAADIAWTKQYVSERRDATAPFDTVVWSQIEDDHGRLGAVLDEYRRAGATWWIETGRPGPDWWPEIVNRVRSGPVSL